MNIHSADTILQFPLPLVDSVTHQLASFPELLLLHQDGATIHTEAISQVDSITYSPGGEEGVPWVVTAAVQAISAGSAQVAGLVSGTGGLPVLERGMCWGTDPFPTVADAVVPAGAGTGAFTASLTGLAPSAAHYARAYATNAIGTAYANMVAFTTATGNFSCGDTLIDARDGRHYLTLQVGGQCWMKENLKYLPEVMGPLSGSASAPRYYVHGYNGTEVDLAQATDEFNTYGVLYNWPAAMNGAAGSNAVPSGVQGVCPAGWHLPGDDEWKLMEIALGMDPDEADDMGFRGTNEGSKFAGNFPLWTNGDLRNDPDFGASGLDARPAGVRQANGTFIQLQGAGRWWTATDVGGNARMRLLSYVNTASYRDQVAKTIGSSVRCVKD